MSLHVVTDNIDDINFAELADEPEIIGPIPVIGKDVISVLSCIKGVATKTIKRDKKIENGKIGKIFNLSRHAVNNIDDLYSLLDTIKSDSKSFIIRGEPVGTETREILRRCKDPKSATFQAPKNGNHWICLDLDSVETSIDIKYPKRVISEFLENSPQLGNTTCVYQLTSSYGIKPGIRAHLWFWLSEPRSDQQCKEWLKTLPFAVDNSLFTPVGVHYTADPIYESGRSPKGSRIGIIRKSENSLYIPSGDLESEIRFWETEIRKLGENGNPRHPVINKAAYFLGSWVGAGVLDATELESRLLTACELSEAFDADRLEQIPDEIRRAIADGAQHPRDISNWRALLKLTSKGLIKHELANYLIIFRHHPDCKNVFGFDVRSGTALILKNPPWDKTGNYPREINDADYIEAVGWINSLGISTTAVAPTQSALNAVVRDNPIDKVKSYLDNLPEWDGIPRLNTWLHDICHSPDNKYYREIGKKFLISMIARAYEPGCKADHMLVLIGTQGRKKSTLFEILASGPGKEYFSDTLGDIENPQHYLPTIMGPWITEIADLSAFSHKENEKIKAFLTVKTDRARLAYGRIASTIPRRGVFVGTTNEIEFLSDLTGNRRYWPVETNDIDLNLARESRDQLFAEAKDLYGLDVPWYLDVDTEILAREKQADHTALDPWESAVQKYLSENPEVTSITTTEILEIVEMPINRSTRGTQIRLGQILRRLGFRRERRLVNGIRVWLYSRTN
jgi:hypothetical protein